MSEYGSLIPHRKAPEDVRVTNWPAKGSLAADYFRVIERRYKEFQSAAKENQIAVMRYYTPRGEEIRVVNVSRHKGEETLLFEGVDQSDNYCDVVVQPQSAQIILRLLTLQEPEPERKPIGFQVFE